MQNSKKFKIPTLSSISHSRALLISSQLLRTSSNVVAWSRRRALRKNPPEPPGNHMSAAVPMPAAPHWWDEDHDRLPNSRIENFYYIKIFLSPMVIFTNSRQLWIILIPFCSLVKHLFSFWGIHGVWLSVGCFGFVLLWRTCESGWRDSGNVVVASLTGWVSMAIIQFILLDVGAFGWSSLLLLISDLSWADLSPV